MRWKEHGYDEVVGMIGRRRMGGSMVRRLLRGGHARLQLVEK